MVSTLSVISFDIINLDGDFVLCQNNKELERITLPIANKNRPLYSYAMETNDIAVNFNKKIFTHRELENYTIKIYVYKDPKYKTLLNEHRIPHKTYKYEDFNIFE